MFKYQGFVKIHFAEPIDLYIKKSGDTIEIIQVSSSDATTDILVQAPELQALSDYIRCSVIHDFGCTSKELKTVPIEIAETLVLVDGDVCNLSQLPELYSVDDGV